MTNALRRGIADRLIDAADTLVAEVCGIDRYWQLERRAQSHYGMYLHLCSLPCRLGWTTEECDSFIRWKTESAIVNLHAAKLLQAQVNKRFDVYKEGD